MQATDVSPSRLGVARDEVKKIVRGLGGADRMLVAQMDAMVTPLGPMTGDTSELERELDAVKATDTRADFPRALRFAGDALRGARAARSSSCPTARWATPPTPPARCTSATRSSVVRARSAKRQPQRRHHQFSVRRYPLDKNRYEVMLEVTNTGAAPEDVELQLLGDGAARRPHQAASPAGRAPSALLPAPLGREPHARGQARPRRRHRTTICPPTITRTPSCPSAGARRSWSCRPATRTSRPRSSSTSTSTSPTWRPRPTPTPLRRAAGTRSSSTASRPPRCRRPTRSTSTRAAQALRWRWARHLVQPGFDKIDRKHPVVRFLALDDVNVARGPQAHAADGRQGRSGALRRRRLAPARGRHARRFQVRRAGLRRARQRSAATHRLAALRARLHQLVHRRGRAVPVELPHGRGVAHPGGRRRGAGDREAARRHDAARARARRARRLLGEHAGFYELHRPTASRTVRRSPRTCSTPPRAPSPAEDAPRSTARSPGAPEGFHVGVRREIWIYLLLAVALLTALEWATYHRRITV